MRPSAPQQHFLYGEGGHGAFIARPLGHGIHAPAEPVYSVFLCLCIRVATLSGRDRPNEALRAGSITRQARGAQRARQVKQVLAAVPREVRNIAPLGRSRHRLPSEPRLHVSMLTIAIAPVLVRCAMEEGLHAVKEEAPDEVPSAIAGPEARRHAGRPASADAGPLARLHPLVDPSSTPEEVVRATPPALGPGIAV